MRKLGLALVSLAAVAVVAGTVFAFRSGSEWSTNSKPALQAFEEGLRAEQKAYWNEAREHYTRALEIDPDFAMAKLKVLSMSSNVPNRKERMQEFLAQIDVNRLSPRERLLIEYRRAYLDEKMDRAHQLVESYLAKNSDDPFVLKLRCDRLWYLQDLPEAEQCYAQLLKADPTWVIAQNNLGYITMAQGRFEEAQKAFDTYRRIAPDQANPHDSLGELLLLRGDDEQARREFQRALQIRSDFCHSWAHLVQLALLRGEFDEARSLIERGRSEVCPPKLFDELACRVQAWEGVEAGASAVSQTVDCTNVPIEDPMTIVALYRRALRAGEAARRDELMDKLKPHMKDDGIKGLARHLKGLALEEEGQLAAAADEYRGADENVSYGADGWGLFKLYNRLRLASLLRRAGHGDDAAALTAEVREVNPAFETRMARLELLNEPDTMLAQSSATRSAR